MAEVKWIKIVTDIFDDEKILLIESMPEADAIIVIWFKMLCLDGKQNNSGVFQLHGRIAYTDEMFATIFRRPLNTVRLALNTFEKFGMIEIVNDTVTIPNWGKHQSIEQIEARREYQRKYHQAYRKQQKLLIESGFLSKKEEEVRLYRIMDLTLLRPLGQRMWGLGTIHCCTADKSTPEFDILKINDSARVKNLISDLVEQQREEKRVVGREFMSEDEEHDLDGDCDHE